MRVILVPLDGSSFAEHALPVALGVATQSGARLVLVSVHEEPAPAHHLPAPDGGPPVAPLIQAALRRYLARVKKRISQRLPDAQVEIAVLGGKAQEVLSTHARDSGADLIVLTTHGRGGPSRSWLGNVAEGVLRRAPVPVLVVRARRKRVTLDPAEPFRHMVIALDGTSESEGIAEGVGILATHGTTTWTLLHVVLPLHPVVRALAPKGAEELDAYEQHTRGEEYLKEAAGRLTRTGIEVRTALGVDLQPARAITEFAAKHGADLIALATHGRGRIGRLLLGSVADKVLRTATVPVLLSHIETGEAADSEAASDEPR